MAAVNVLDLSNCGLNGNTGVFPCAFNPTIFKRFIMMPKGTVIPAATLVSGNAAVIAYIVAGLKNDNPGLRWHMSGVLSQMKDNTDSEKTEDKDGYKAITQRPPYNFEWDMTLQFAQFVKWKAYDLKAQNTYDFIFVDDSGTLIGAHKLDATGVTYGLGGVSLFQYGQSDAKFATVSTQVKFNVTMVIQNNFQLNAGTAMVQAGFVPGDYADLLFDAVITVGDTASTATSIKFRLLTDGVGAKTNLLEKYGALLDAAAFIIRDNGTPITPTSGPTYDPVGKQMVATVSAITSGHTISIVLAAPSVVGATPYFLNAVTEGTYSYVSP